MGMCKFTESFIMAGLDGSEVGDGDDKGKGKDEEGGAW